MFLPQPSPPPTPQSRSAVPISFALIVLSLCGLLNLLPILDRDEAAAQETPLAVDEFVFEQAPFAQCHASTLAETSSGLVVAWFAGTEESHPDVEIWVSRQVDSVWTAPVSVANGIQADGTRFPCWNPVLVPIGPRLYLFYKVGPNPREWWGHVMASDDQGQTWGESTRLPEGILGPIKNKPLVLDDQTLLSGSSTEHDGWRVHTEWTTDRGKTWHRSEPLNDKGELESIQPTLLRQADDSLRMLCRSHTSGHITTATSSDQGQTWSSISEIDLPNPNSGIDAVTLSNGTHALIYNHTDRGRSPLNLAISNDGVLWSAAATLIAERRAEFSYPAIIQTADGMLHITYTWKRTKIRHVVIDPSNLQLTPMVDGNWPE